MQGRWEDCDLSDDSTPPPGSNQGETSLTAIRSIRLPLAVFLLAFFATWTLRATWLYSIDEQIASPWIRFAYANAVKSLLWLAPAAIFTARILRQRPTAFCADIWPGRQQWIACILITTLYLAAVAAFELSVGNKRFSLHRISSGSGDQQWPSLFVTLQLLVSPLIEELFFRGFLLPTMYQIVGRWTAIATNSLLFMLIHWPYWLSHAESARLFVANSIGVCGFALLASWLYDRSRSVWPPTLAHTCNNLLAMVLVAN